MNTPSQLPGTQAARANGPSLRKTFFRRRCRLFFRAGAVLFALWIVFEVALRFVPLPAGLFATAPGALEVVDRHGRSLRTLRPAGGAFNRLVVYEQLPQSLIAATLAAEDKRFWKHAGVDWRASLRALAGLVKNRRVVSGGSTITQQLIKLTEPRPRTIRTKFIEALQAMRLEQIWDKQRILAEYFNRLDYGNLTTGPAEAAWQYFGKPLSDLSLAEAALLAGLPQSPGRLNPHTRLDRACKRQAWILSRLERNGQISAADRRRAGAEPLRLVDGRRVFEAPHFVDLLLQSVDPADATRAQSSIAAPGDGRSLVQQRSSHRSLRTVCTTLDLELNRFLERSIRHQLDELQGRNVHDGAAVVIDNKNSAVLALVGSGDYFAGRAGQVNGAWAPRSAGSTLKPFTYLLAFEQGANPATIVDDLLAEFATATGVFAPENYNRRCYGPMSYRRALANSLNISAVKVLQSVGGAAALQRRLQGFGLTTLTQTPEHYGLGLTIGNAEVRLLELANAYATLARLGEYRPWQLVSGENPPATAAVSTGSAWLIADILSDNNARALAFGLESPLRFDFPVACKTGTSSGFRDNWALGFTPEFTVGVWMGNFDGTPMREVSGVSGAAPVLHEMFERLHEQFGTTAFPTPANIVERTVHPLTGKILTGYEASGVQEKFLKNFLPPVETAADYDDTGRVRLPACYREWLAGAENWLGTAAVAENAGGLQQLRLVSPQPGTTFFIDADLPPSSRAIPLRAEGGSSLRWESESLECRAAAGGPVAVMREGRHRLTVMCSDTGERMETWVTVKLR